MFSLLLNPYSPVLRALLDVCIGWILVSVARILWNQFHVSYLLRHVPGPKAPSWLWGSEWQVLESAPGAPYVKWKQQYGDVVKYKGALGVSGGSCRDAWLILNVLLSQRNMLAISDHRAATYILGDHVYDFPKPQGVREWFRLLVGEGLLVVEGMG